MSNKHYIYRHYSKDGALLYVGVSLSLLKRISEHKDNSHWFSEISVIKLTKCETRQEALEIERRAITDENPKYNLLRPKVQDEKIHTKKSESDKELIKRIVQFNPTYSLDDAGRLMGVGVSTIKKWIDEGKLGYIVIGLSSGRWGTSQKRRITGWQLIDFIEYLESSSTAPNGQDESQDDLVEFDAVNPR